jgi:hypothetical protein
MREKSHPETAMEHVMFGPLRKAAKVVVYTAIPVAGPAKAAVFGTRRGNLHRKETCRQTALLERQNRLLAAQAPRPATLVTPDGQWVSYDGGDTYQRA